MTGLPYGFRIVGPCTSARLLVDARQAFAAHADCDQRAEVEREAYLSAFHFDEDFRQQLEETGSVRGFGGDCWAPWTWWDIDRESDLQAALEDTRRLAVMLTERYGAGDDDLLVFYSGSKGFHIGLPTSMWSAKPSVTFHRSARRFAEHAAELAGVAIDTGVYDRVRAFRAPNSRHPKTGRYKRQLGVAELLHLSTDAVLERAAHPAPFDVPEPGHRSEQAATDWQAAIQRADCEDEDKRRRRAASVTATLNRLTLDFIREGAGTGDRHRLLFSAAANLAEFGCPPPLAHALLTDAALDCGLRPSDARRQIDCGLEAARRGGVDG